MKSHTFFACVVILLIQSVQFAALSDQLERPEKQYIHGLVVLCTDYGADSVDVAAVKGAAYSVYPELHIDTLTNSIESFDVVEGAILLAEYSPLYPPGTIFCCSVDPGADTDIIILKTKSGHLFVAPDNGLLTLVEEQLGIERIYKASNPSYWRIPDPDRTFRGRNILGPVAAYIAKGVPLESFGPAVEEMTRLDVLSGYIQEGKAVGTVFRIDGFGNLITTITREVFEDLAITDGTRLFVTIGDIQFEAPLVGGYGDVPEGEPLTLVQEDGYIQFAINMDNMSERLEVQRNALVIVEKCE